ncbi:MAG TPA: hypothetical protein VF543_12400 [Pyrinomonadaceae bacterium]
MNSIYAMQRANGDWFALNDDGRLRVPVFHSASEAMEARSRNPGMLLFKPVVVDELALDDLAPTATEKSAGYWLVSNPSLNLRRGRLLDHEQLLLLVRDNAQLPQE